MAEKYALEAIPTWEAAKDFIDRNEFPCPLCGHSEWEIPLWGDRWLYKIPLTGNDGNGIFPMGLTAVLTVCIHCAFVAPRAVYRMGIEPGSLAGEVSE